MLKKLRSFFQKKTQFETIYQELGEEKGVYELVKIFYQIMETDSNAHHCLLTHKLVDGKIEDHVKKKLFLFLIGWTGGPNLYTETFGPPRMRARHLHVTIGPIHKNEWLYCMKLALEKHPNKYPRSLQQRMLSSFTALAMRIQNTEEVLSSKPELQGP